MISKRTPMWLLPALLMCILFLSGCGGPGESAAEAAEVEPAANPAAATKETENPTTPQVIKIQPQTELNIFNWSTYIAPGIIPKFEEKYNVKVNYDMYESNEDLLAKIQAGNPGYDLIVPGDYMVEIMRNLDLLTEIDQSNIPNMANLNPTFLDLPFDPGNQHCLPYQWGTMALGYNATKVDGDIDSWQVMFDDTLDLRRAWLDDARSTIGVALMLLGYDVNTTDPDQIAEATAMLVKQKKLVTAYAPDTGQIMLDDGEVDVAAEWSGDILQIMEENPDIRLVIPKEGAMAWVDSLCIPKGAPHKEMAENFINFILDAEIGAELSNYVRFATPNAAAMAMINPEDLSNPGIYPPAEVMDKLQFLVDVGDATLLYDDAWTEIKAAN
ncbi:MAG: spermidine/putrescine ABC transporter substrate-binding protein [Caldilineaceae bacterium]|nr:spermidine/putrescine ABC transporter substrate-binding protein [Caldilineaceae bacterium]